MTEITARLSTALSDRYRIERHLGEGGMATVYLAEDLKHERKVALKVLKPELAAVLGAERFVQEIKTTANLQHPHILPLFDSGEADSFLYYVMPFVDGETLRDKLNRETQLGIDEAVKITTDVADALDYAHRNNVIHRDVKPENILLHDGRPMVADFGIALAVSAAAGGRMTETGLSLGTPHYMSPEQATAEKDLTDRSDIYSLGCVLYEMLIGEPPHTGASAQAIVMKIVSEDVQPVSELRKSVPANVAAATTKALEKLAADRFETAKEFAEALTNPTFALPTTQAASAAAAMVSGPWNRLTVGVTAVAALLAAMLLWSVSRPEPPKPVVRYTLVLDAERAAIQALFGTSIALSPDGSRLIYVGPSDEVGFQLWLRERDRLEARPLPGTDWGQHPFFAPDGEHVGFVTNDRALKVVSLTGEPPLTLVESDVNRLGGAWGADGYVYFRLVGHRGLMRVSTSGGGVPEPVATLDTTQQLAVPRWPDVLPNGKGVLATVGGDGNTANESDSVAVVALATGEHRVLVQGILGRYAASGHLVYVRYDGALLAAPFDENKLELIGPAVPLLAGMPVQPGPDLALSQSGRLVYSAVGDPGGVAGIREIAWVDRAGRATGIEPGWTLRPYPQSGPVLSPDQTRLALAVQGPEGVHIWIKELDGGPFQRLTFEGALNFRPVWSPDGGSVTYSSDQLGSRDLFERRANGVGQAEVRLDLEREVVEGVWSRDGQWLVVRTGTDRDILAIRPGVDSVPVPLLTGEFEENAPALSPNGRWLAYVSDESGRPEVYVRSFPNVATTKRQVSTEGGVEPVWAHSGQELFYRSSEQELVAVTVRTDSTFAVVQRRALFTFPQGPANFGYVSHALYDVSLDDERFMIFRPVDANADAELIVVENFLEELKAKVGR